MASTVPEGNRFDRITFDPEMMGGRACIRGMRVTVATIIDLIAEGPPSRMSSPNTLISSGKTFDRRLLTPRGLRGTRWCPA